MARLTEEDKLRINEVYYEVGTYAETARKTGFSAGTVKKYVINNFKPSTKENDNFIHFKLKDLPSEIPSLPVDDLGSVCIHTEAELKELEIFWEELIL